jgi:acyltransferase
MDNKRFREIDFMKGFGIVLMILGHIPVNTCLTRYIYMFHIPLFFIASGFLYRQNLQCSLYILFKKWFTRLIFPYLLFVLCGYALWLIEIKPQTVPDMLKPIISALWINTEGMPINGAVWYLTATLFVYLIYSIIDRNINNAVYKTVLILTMAFMGLLLRKVSFRLPWAIDISFLGIGFFYFGIVTRKYYFHLWKRLNRIPNIWRKTMILAVLSVITWGGFYNGNVSMRTRTYGNSGLFFSAAALILVVCYLIISKWIVTVFSNSLVIKKMESIGRNSIVYLGFNELVINIVGSVLTKLGVTSYSYTILNSLASIMILTIIVAFMRKIKLLSSIFFIH